MVGEARMVGLLSRIFCQKPGSGSLEAELGIGDDACVLRFGRERLVWTVDACVEGVHFDRRWLGLGDIGWRAFAAAASDLGAMGARPVGALSSLVLPDHFAPRHLQQLARGQERAARALGCPVLGGNLSRGRELSITTTALGICRKPLLRSGARPGDELWLVGRVGLARAGLELLRRERPVRATAERSAVRAWRRPDALVERGIELRAVAHACIDISDGLSGDAAHLAESSRVRVVIEEARLSGALPKSLREMARTLKADALELALSGGEDYALLAAGPGPKRPAWARAIGRVERGRGVVRETADGTQIAAGHGFDHFG